MTGRICFTQAQRKVVADLLPELSDRLNLAEKNSRTITFTANELTAILREAEAARPHADTGMKRNSLRQVVDAVTKALQESEGGSIPASERLYQFKITLLESQPPIWRRIQVKHCTLDRLHEHIQIAMGWTNRHLHQFRIDGERYGDPDLIDDGFEDFECVDSTITKINEIVPRDGKRFRFLYEYDFGDGWKHEVLFEGCLKAEKVAGILCASKVREIVHQKRLAASGDTSSTLKPSPIRSTSSTTTSWSGVARLTLRSSMQ